MKLKLLLAGVLGLSVIVTSNVMAQAATDTYNSYARISQRSAGDFYDRQNNFSGQWSWKTESNSNQWSVAWDRTKPNSREQFMRSTDGNWILLDGWSDNGTYYTQRVTQEWYGDGNCNNMTPFKSDNARQHYVLNKVYPGPYCLLASGTITEQSSGITFNFRHRQIWSGPQKCSNRYIANQTCIKQYEVWADDNGHDFRITLKRDNYLAKGLGMAFRSKQYYRWENGKVLPYWEADMRYHWTY